MSENKNEIAVYKEEIQNLVADPKIFANLLKITFNGLKAENALQAMLEGRMIGFTLQNFLQKDVYAIPFKDGYSLVGSIDYARKIGQKNGVCGTEKPIYTEDENGNILTCEITVKKLVNGIIGDFTALVYFKEYSTGKNLWFTKPRTMIAKVAEMHALRKACPEQLDKLYVEEEYNKPVQVQIDEKEEAVVVEKTWKQKMDECKTLDELAKVWEEAPASLKKEEEVVKYKNKLKTKIDPVQFPETTEEVKVEETKNETVEGEVIEAELAK